MARTIKYPREHITNYDRYYQVEDNIELCENCPGKNGCNKWNSIYKNILFKPVDTNWSIYNVNNITTVIISESPSNEETSYGVPTVGKTGVNIYKTLINATLQNGWLKELDEQIYRTNIVRCQADAGIKGDTVLKNQRVKEAWEHCKMHLRNELEKIFSNLNNNSNLKIYISPGKSFTSQIKQIKRIIEELKRRYNYINVEIEDSNHFSSI